MATESEVLQACRVYQAAKVAVSAALTARDTTKLEAERAERAWRVATDELATAGKVLLDLIGTGVPPEPVAVKAPPVVDLTMVPDPPKPDAPAPEPHNPTKKTAKK